MMKTRKDFEAKAAELAADYAADPNNYNGRDAVARAYEAANLFAASNPRFDRDRFYEACGMVHLCRDAHRGTDGTWERV